MSQAVLLIKPESRARLEIDANVCNNKDAIPFERCLMNYRLDLLSSAVC